MEPYIIVFILNLLLSYIAEKFYDSKYKFQSVLFLILLVGVNTIFSGFRDFGIGIDTTVYIDSYFTIAHSINLKEFFAFEGDRGFLLLAYFANLISTDSQALLIVTALFIQGFYFLALWQLKKVTHISIFLSTAFFCIIFYAHTLNLMRQFCAMSLLTFAFSLYIQGKYKIYTFLQIVAFFFHSSSIIFLIVPIMWTISKMENVKVRNCLSFIAILGMTLFVTSFFYALSLLGNLGIVSEVYADRYGTTGDLLQSTAASTGTGLGKLFTFCYPIAFLVYAKLKQAVEFKLWFFMFVLCVLYSLLQLLAYQVAYMDRLSFYFSYIFYIMQVLIFSSKRMPFAVKIIMILLYINNWYTVNAVVNGGEIYPYKSKILNVR